MSQTSDTREKALVMLGGGAPVGIVASALGVTDSVISQFLAEEDFARQVTDLKFKSLTRQTALDDRYTGVEEKLLDKFEKVMPLMTRPRDVVAALTAINNTKRRGISNNNAGTVQNRIVNLVIPVTIAHKFISNVNNQVVEVQDDSGCVQSLVTTSSGSLNRLSREILGNNSDSSPETLAIGSNSEALPARPGAGRFDQDVIEGTITVDDLM